MQPAVKTLVVVSLPRSGTNYFCATIGTIRNALSMGEIFSPTGVMGLSGKSFLESEFAAEIGAEGHRTPGLIGTFRTDPLRSVARIKRAMREAPNKSLLSFKVFPDQLTEEDLHALCSSHADAAIILVRARLDCFVSLLIARKAGTFHSVDTSDIRVEVDPDAFLEWAREADAWLARQERMIRDTGLPLILLSYDIDVNKATPLLQEKIYFLLRSLMLPAVFPKPRDKVHFSKQDDRSDVFDRISNAGDLRAALESRNLLDYALKPPLSEATEPAPSVATEAPDAAPANEVPPSPRRSLLGALKSALGR